MMTKKTLKLSSLFFSSALLIGCGQMGPLYLPQEKTNTNINTQSESLDNTETKAVATSTTAGSDNSKNQTIEKKND